MGNLRATFAQVRSTPGETFRDGRCATFPQLAGDGVVLSSPASAGAASIAFPGCREWLGRSVRHIGSRGRAGRMLLGRTCSAAPSRALGPSICCAVSGRRGYRRGEWPSGSPSAWAGRLALRVRGPVRPRWAARVAGRMCRVCDAVSGRTMSRCGGPSQGNFWALADRPIVAGSVRLWSRLIAERALPALAARLRGVRSILGGL